MYYQDLGLPIIPTASTAFVDSSGHRIPVPTKPVAPGEPIPGQPPAQVPAAAVTGGAPSWLKIAAVAALGLGGYLYWRKRKQGKKR